MLKLSRFPTHHSAFPLSPWMNFFPTPKNLSLAFCSSFSMLHLNHSCIRTSSNPVPMLLISNSVVCVQHSSFHSLFSSLTNVTWPLASNSYLPLADRIICWQIYLKDFTSKAYVFFFQFLTDCHLVSVPALSQSTFSLRTLCCIKNYEGWFTEECENLL